MVEEELHVWTDMGQDGCCVHGEKCGSPAR